MNEECEHGTEGPCGPCFDQHIATLTKERDELQSCIGAWRGTSELQRENVFSLLKGYPKAVAILRKALRANRGA